MNQINTLLKKHDVTNLTCAACWCIVQYDGKVYPESCPNCGSTNKSLTKARYWTNGVPDYSVNLMK